MSDSTLTRIMTTADKYAGGSLARLAELSDTELLGHPNFGEKALRRLRDMYPPKAGVSNVGERIATALERIAAVLERDGYGCR